MTSANNQLTWLEIVFSRQLVESGAISLCPKHKSSVVKLHELSKQFSAWCKNKEQNLNKWKHAVMWVSVYILLELHVHNKYMGPLLNALAWKILWLGLVYSGAQLRMRTRWLFVLSLYFGKYSTLMTINNLKIFNPDFFFCASVSSGRKSPESCLLQPSSNYEIASKVDFTCCSTLDITS